MNTVYSTFRARRDETPHATAVIDVDGRQISYADFDALVDTIADLFPDRTPGRVGIVMNHNVEMIAALFAVLKRGAAFVAAEPDQPLERTNFMLRQAGVDFVITSPEYASRFAGYMILPLPWNERIVHGLNVEAVPVEPSSPAYILYTSGTTGKPKGVIVTNGNVCHYANAFASEFRPRPGEDVMAQFSVCTFDIFIEEVFGSLLNGMALAIVPDKIRRENNVRALLEYIEKNDVSILSGFPYLLQDINRSGLPLPDSLRLLISGGDVLRASYIDRLLPLVEIYNTYGPSETTVCATYMRCNNVRPLDDGTYPIGHDINGVKVTVCDPAGIPVADGVHGELYISGNGVSQGYLVKVPESENFFTDHEGKRVYKSGDIGYRLPSGDLAFLHRKDTQVMIMGKRVECDEAENVLSACTEVERALVRPFVNETGHSYMVAYIVPHNRDTFSPARLRMKISTFLMPFMIPKFFVLLDKIPLTVNGKPNRDALPQVLDL